MQTPLCSTGRAPASAAVRAKIKEPARPDSAPAAGAVPARALQDPVAARAHDGSDATSRAEYLYRLKDDLHPADVRRLERRLRFLSDRQIEHLAQSTDLAARSPRFADLLQVKAGIDRQLEYFYEPIAHPRLRSGLERWVDPAVLTPALSAKILAVLMTGLFTEKVGLSLPGGKLLDHVPGTKQLRGILETDRWALQKFWDGLGRLPAEHQEKFLRSTAFELAQIDDELLARVLERTGVARLKAQFPFLQGTPETIPELITELARTDHPETRAYLSDQRVAPRIQRFDAARNEARIRKVAAAIARADEYAQSHRVDLASPDHELEWARDLYREAAAEVRKVVAADPLAIQSPVIKKWMARRSAALFVAGAVEEIESGVRPSFSLTGKLRAALRSIPGMASKVRQVGAAETTLLESLARELRFDPVLPRSAAERAAVVRALATRSLLPPEMVRHAPEGAPAPSDPLIHVMLPPERKKLEHTYLLFAPGVVPIAGVLVDAFAHLDGSLGIKTATAATGFFKGEFENARAIQKAFDEVLARDPQAKFILLGYSQGAVNALTFLDQLRTGPRKDREAARRVRAVLSVYGAHNGSPSAQRALDLAHEVIQRLPRGADLEYLLSGVKQVGHFVAGGVNSLRRSTRDRFWSIANLPSDIPYGSIAARTEPDEVPYVLRPSYQVLREDARKLGLAEDNDTQVLFHDAPLGNETSEMGRAIRRNCTTVYVHGHHWNPLSPAQMYWDPEAAKYGFPKWPQVSAHLENLAELGLI